MTFGRVRACGWRVVAAVMALGVAGCARDGSRATLPPALDPLVRNLDSTAAPGADFFAYANGSWLKANPIPESERGWSIGHLVDEETYRQRLAICEEAAAAPATPGSSAQKVGDFFATGMDSVGIEAQGLAPIAPWLAAADSVTARADVPRVVARFQRAGFAPLYRFAVEQDERNSTRHLVHLHQGGLGLPDRDYYLATDPANLRIRDAYVAHLGTMFGLLGEERATARRSAADVMRIETALARRSRTLEQLRDPWANYNAVALASLAEQQPAMEWLAQFEAMQVPPQDTVIVGQPEFLAAAADMVNTEPPAAWRSYLRWTCANALANRLPAAFDQADFRFYGTVLSGTPARRPRWKRVVDAAEDGIGELLGQEWVKRHCSPRTKARYERLTQEIFDVYRERIRALPWMTEATKQKAIAKLDKVGRKVAYPDRWRDYSALAIARDAFAANQVRINTWWFQHALDKLGRPVDRSEWNMTPQTYNAYYDESKVEIVLPAAIFMIPGVPDSLVDDALLYSYVGGSTIGHEITHGFDDEGRQFDADGNLRPWWTAEDSVQFAARAQRLVKQFDAYVVGDRHVRGQATLGENIADLGGVVLGYEAFKRTAQWTQRQEVNGLGPDQRYFLGFALSWLGHRRPEALAQQIMTDVHAPQYLRVNGPLANLPEFHAAFGVKDGDAMWRPESLRVAIW